MLAQGRPAVEPEDDLIKSGIEQSGFDEKLDGIGGEAWVVKSCQRVCT